MLTELRSAIEKMAGFTHSAKTRRQKNSVSAAVEDGFLLAVAAACDKYPELASGGQITGAEIRDLIAFTNAYAVVIQELAMLSRSVADTIAERRAAVAQKCRRVYQLAKSINRPEDRETLVPHVTAMQKYARRGGRPKRLATPPVAPVAAPLPVAPAASIAPQLPAAVKV
jgi:hypothetical protein